MSGLDAETQHALFPNFPTADASSRGSRWKWSDIGAAPALHNFAQRTQQSAAAQDAACSGPTAEQEAPITAKLQAVPELHRAAGRNASSQGKSVQTSQRSSPTGVHTRSRSCSPDPEHYLVSLRWGAPSAPPLQRQAPTPQGHLSGCRSPCPPRFSTSSSRQDAKPPAIYESLSLTRDPPPDRLFRPQDQSERLVADGFNCHEGSFRSASPSVARACVTLPGFCPPARAPHPAEASPTEEEEQHRPVASPSAGKHTLREASKIWPVCCHLSLLHCS